MKKLIVLLFVLNFMFFLQGCAKVQLANLEEGKSSTRNVEKLLGEPVTKSYGEDGVIWEYIFEQVKNKNTKTKQRRPGQIQQQLVLKVKFDDKVYDGYNIEVIEKVVEPMMQQRPAMHGQLPHGASVGNNSFMTNFDSNNDGKVSRQEFTGPDKVFDRLDRNNDGYIEADEAPTGRRPTGRGGMNNRRIRR